MKGSLGRRGKEVVERGEDGTCMSGRQRGEGAREEKGKGKEEGIRCRYLT